MRPLGVAELGRRHSSSQTRPAGPGFAHFQPPAEKCPRTRRTAPAFAAVLVLAASPSAAAELKPATLGEFQRYVRAREADLQTRLHGTSFLSLDSDPRLRGRVRQGEIVVRAWGRENPVAIESGLIHDWSGAVHIPGVDVATVLRLVQDYDRHQDVYAPEVAGSRLRGRNGNDYSVHLRLRKHKLITVVLNTEHDVRYFPIDSTRAHSRSYATRIAEVENPGTPRERELAPGGDHGFLWGLHSYWRFLAGDGGVYVECDAISLTRGIPFGLGALLTPVIRDLPRESLTATLAATRNAFRSR